MVIPTEPIGSIPRPADVIAAWNDRQAGRLSLERFREIADLALRDTIKRFEETGSSVITDGEQTKSSFATYPLDGATGLASDGVVVPFEDGHTRQLPRLTTGPFRYATFAATYLSAAKSLTALPVKQAVISASALSLLYPDSGIPGYPREAFLNDLVSEAVADIRQCLEQGADSVQIDFTEGRLSLKLDPTGHLLEQFIALNNEVLDAFSSDERTSYRCAHMPRRRSGLHAQRRHRLCGTAAGAVPAASRTVLRPVGERTRSGARSPADSAASPDEPDGLRRCDRSSQSDRRNARAGERSRTAGCPVHSNPGPRHDRRLRLRTIRRRHVDFARDRVSENPGAGGRNPACGPSAVGCLRCERSDSPVSLNRILFRREHVAQ